MYRSEVISVLYEQNFISFYINTLGPFSRALSQLHVRAIIIYNPLRHTIDNQLRVHGAFLDLVRSRTM